MLLPVGSGLPFNGITFDLNEASETEPFLMQIDTLNGHAFDAIKYWGEDDIIRIQFTLTAMLVDHHEYQKASHNFEILLYPDCTEATFFEVA